MFAQVTIRATDLEASTRFYDGARGTILLVAGDTPTRHAALAFPASSAEGTDGVMLDPDGNDVEVRR